MMQIFVASGGLYFGWLMWLRPPEERGMMALAVCVVWFDFACFRWPLDDVVLGGLPFP